MLDPDYDPMPDGQAYESALECGFVSSLCAALCFAATAMFVVLVFGID